MSRAPSPTPPPPSSPPPASRRALWGALSLALAAGIWLPLLHRLYRPSDAELSALGSALYAEQLADLEEPARLSRRRARMRQGNAEWDFMGRTFLALSLAERAHSDPAQRERSLAHLDSLIEGTLREERAHGPHHFLMAYSRAGSFVQQPARSIFLDGEIALMLAARLSLGAEPAQARELRQRVDLLASRMEASPMLSGESYPDECWTFCNTVALAAIRVSDRLDGRDHGALLSAWVRNARAHLVHEESGLLVSSYTYEGRHLDGPEGSSVFLAAHMLRLIDPAFAEDQYRRAREELGEELLGFGYAREWPRSWEGPADIDSGPVIPVMEASAGASGMAILGAAAFGDRAYLRHLVTSLELAAFPIREEGRLRYAASNQVGDAVLLYGLSLAEGEEEEPSALFRYVRGAEDGAGPLARNDTGAPRLKEIR